jgi:hypothetical protein
MHFAGPNVERYILKRTHAWEGFADVPQCQSRFALGLN